MVSTTLQLTNMYKKKKNKIKKEKQKQKANNRSYIFLVWVGGKKTYTDVVPSDRKFKLRERWARGPSARNL